MNRRKVERYKFISFICIIILICELVYIGYHFIYKSEESVYFEGVNAIASGSKYYVSVGSNNDNDNHFEKAKVIIYNTKREKEYERLYNVGFNSSFFGVAIDEDGFIAVGSYDSDGTITNWPYDQKFYIILNLAIGGNLGGDNYVDNLNGQAEFLIDYVRVYQ